MYLFGCPSWKLDFSYFTKYLTFCVAHVYSNGRALVRDDYIPDSETEYEILD